MLSQNTGCGLALGRSCSIWALVPQLVGSFCAAEMGPSRGGAEFLRDSKHPGKLADALGSVSPRLSLCLAAQPSCALTLPRFTTERSAGTATPPRGSAGFSTSFQGSPWLSLPSQCMPSWKPMRTITTPTASGTCWWLAVSLSCSLLGTSIRSPGPGPRSSRVAIRSARTTVRSSML